MNNPMNKFRIFILSLRGVGGYIHYLLFRGIGSTVAPVAEAGLLSLRNAYDCETYSCREYTETPSRIEGNALCNHQCLINAAFIGQVKLIRREMRMNVV